MNDFFAAIILGIVEGLTEFLPVSSTAHIRFSQELLQQDLSSDYWKMFAIVIQLGAILSVVVYFRQRIAEFVRSYPRGGEGTCTWWNHPLALVAISFVATAIPCYIIDKQIGENLEHLQLMGLALIIGGVAMALIDYGFSRRASIQRMEEMSIWHGVFIGFTQILAAAFPGTSRSMSTIAGGQIVGLSRSAALEFSFFLSIPVMFAATSFKLLKFVLGQTEGVSQHQWGVLAVGFVVSFLVAWAVIAWFMKWVKQHGFLIFAVYRVIAGTIVLLLK